MAESFYESVNNGVYKCGFAITQEAYEEAFVPLFEKLDELEEVLSKSVMRARQDQRRNIRHSRLHERLTCVVSLPLFCRTPPTHSAT